MTIATRVVGQVTVLHIDGRMTRNEGYGGVKAQAVELLGQERIHFLLNLTDVPYMDSTCVGELVSAFVAVRNKGRTLKLCGASGRLSGLLTVAKLDTVFEIFEIEAAALDRFARTSGEAIP